MQLSNKELPDIVAGPILRHVQADTLTSWLVTSMPCHLTLMVYQAGETNALAASCNQQTFAIGAHAFIHVLKTHPDQTLVSGQLYEYDIDLQTIDEDEQDSSKSNAAASRYTLASALASLRYENQARFSFRYQAQLSQVLHGSCRKAHFDGDDALTLLDDQIAKEIASLNEETPKIRPDIMLMTGDQVYVDDVAGPMLHAIHQVIELLGLFDEPFDGATVDSLYALMQHPDGFYQREKLIPEVKGNNKLTDAFFEAKKKPVFTSVNAHNHLMGLSEMLALYLLSWSSRLWPLVSLDKTNLSAQHKQQYQHEVPLIQNFSQGLGKIERALAHIPNYMIFDDHDVTDDWNLTRAWEEQVYGHPFSQRIIANAMAAYFLCQGIGNPDSQLRPLIEHADKTFRSEGLWQYDEFLNAILDFAHWHYRLDTSPPVHVLDTRTQRWRSESNPNKPSGLMDWEGLCQLQHDMVGQEAVIMVSAAPIYGVKFIETVQKIFTIFGGALVVDAENWMAHRGTASVMLNIFRHIKTPPNFIILSGDVHYSFVYDVSLRFRRNSPHITQFTSSGIHNEFPDKLLSWFDKLNRWLYGRKSPLNWLTKRRNMSVRQRKPMGKGLASDRFLVNHCNLGLLKLNQDATHVECELLLTNGNRISFRGHE